MTGRVPDMRTYLEQAAVFVCPLRLGAGIKNKVLEALAMRLPVIATPLSVDGIAVRDGQEALIAESDDELIAAALRVLGDPALHAALGANGRALIEARYSWPQVAERYERFTRRYIMSEYIVKTFRERSDKLDENWHIIAEGWAEFMLNDTIANVYFCRLYEDFPEYQFMLYDGDIVVATCNSIPVIWDLKPDHLFDAGWDWALESGFHNLRQGARRPRSRHCRSPLQRRISARV